VHTVAYAPGGSVLASTAEDRRVVLWDPVARAKRREWTLPGVVHDVAFAPDSRHLATANGNGTVYILRLAKP
jgi:hypothetical protein